MRILVCIKQVPGTAKVEVDAVTGVLKRDGIDSKMNPYDIYALETAFRIREQRGGIVTVITMGPPQAASVIKESYMMGADEGIILSDRKFAGSDVLATSHTISQGIKKIQKPDLIICGKQTTDGDTAQVGPEVAEYLGIPHVSNVRKILELKENSIIVEMDMPETVEVVEINYPCLITVEKDIFQPRLPSFRMKMETKDREVKIFSMDDFEDKNEKNYGLSGSPTQVERIFPPQANGRREIWKGNSQYLEDKLVDKLQNLRFI